MPIVTADDSFAQRVLDKIVAKYMTKEARTGLWHVSDIMFPRYAIWGRITERKPDREQIGFFFTGEAYHEFLQKILGEMNAEKRVEWEKMLVATADYLDEDVLLEIKTSRKWTIPEMPSDTYVEQVGYYAAIHSPKAVRILVIYPTANRKWDNSASSTVEVRAWKVTFSEEELEEIRANMRERVAQLERVWKSKRPEDIESLPACPDWKFGSVERDSEKKEYFVKVRCPFYTDKLCSGKGCSESVIAECQRKNDNRRVLPNGEKPPKRTRQPKSTGQDSAGSVGESPLARRYRKG